MTGHERLSLVDLAALLPYEREQRSHDVWRLYHDPRALSDVPAYLSEPFEEARVTHVAGAEARGFLLGGLVAARLGCAFVPVRKVGRYLPGHCVSAESLPDWEGKRVRFSMQDTDLLRDARVLLIDDWYTTGNQARAIADLLDRVGAEIVGASVMVEEGVDRLAVDGWRFHSLLRWDEQGAQFGISPFNGCRRATA
jgi:adenine phosphoribosyltransferase